MRRAAASTPGCSTAIAPRQRAGVAGAAVSSAARRLAAACRRRAGRNQCGRVVERASGDRQLVVARCAGRARACASAMRSHAQVLATDAARPPVILASASGTALGGSRVRAGGFQPAAAGGLSRVPEQRAELDDGRAARAAARAWAWSSCRWRTRRCSTCKGSRCECASCRKPRWSRRSSRASTPRSRRIGGCASRSTCSIPRSLRSIRPARSCAAGAAGR